MSEIIEDCSWTRTTPDNNHVDLQIVRRYWLVLAGFLVLYAPVYVNLVQGLWARPEFAYGPVVMLVSFSLITVCATPPGFILFFFRFFFWGGATGQGAMPIQFDENMAGS